MQRITQLSLLRSSMAPVSSLGSLAPALSLQSSTREFSNGKKKNNKNQPRPRSPTGSDSASSSSTPASFGSPNQGAQSSGSSGSSSDSSRTPSQTKKYFHQLDKPMTLSERARLVKKMNENVRFTPGVEKWNREYKINTTVEEEAKKPYAQAALEMEKSIEQGDEEKARKILKDFPVQNEHKFQMGEPPVLMFGPVADIIKKILPKIPPELLNTFVYQLRDVHFLLQMPYDLDTSKFNAADRRLHMYASMIKRFFHRPTITSRKVRELRSVFPKALFLPQVRTMLKWMIINDQLDHFEELVPALFEQAQAMAGIVKCTLTVSEPISDEQRDQILEIAKPHLEPNQRLYVSTVIDSTLIAGYRLEIDGKQFDRNLQNDYDDFKQALTNRIRQATPQSL